MLALLSTGCQPMDVVIGSCSESDIDRVLIGYFAKQFLGLCKLLKLRGFGAPGMIRTCDPLVRSQRLSTPVDPK